MRQDSDQPLIWALRLTSRAKADSAAALDYFTQKEGIEIARAWKKGFDTEIAKLAQIPTRWPLAEEDKLFRENVRRMLYRRSSGGPAYRVLFVLREHPDDAPAVTIIHVRHAAQKPMPRKEARKIESSE